MLLASTLATWLLSALFIAAGTAHFVRPDLFARIVPPWLPAPLLLVYLSGAAELILGAMLLVPRLTPLAAWGLIALLIAVFPANIHMAVHAEEFPRFSPLALWLRLPIQGLLIAWAWWLTRPR